MTKKPTSAERRNISMGAAVEQRAEHLIRARGFNGLSDLIQTLIREEYERRNPPAVAPLAGAPQLLLNDTPAPALPGPAELAALRAEKHAIAKQPPRRRPAPRTR